MKIVISFIAGSIVGGTIGVLGTAMWVGFQLEKNYPDLYSWLLKK